MRNLVYGLFLFSIIACACSSDLPEQAVSKPVLPKFMSPAEAHLGIGMKNMHYFTMKLGVSVRKYNFALAQFYTQELKEVADEIISQNIIEDGINFSEQMKNLLYPHVNKMEESLTGSSIEQIKESYTVLISSCNSCHAAVKHGFVKVTEPKGEIDGQDFEAIEK